MSSRIVPASQAGDAEALNWRAAGERVCQAGETAENIETQGAPDSAGHSMLAARLRELEQQIPVREQQARQAGRREGEAAAAAQWEPALERLARTAAELAGLRGRLRREAEEDVVRLSMAVARRILRRELTVDPEALLGLVKAALERIDQRELHRLRVRPEDAARVSAFLERIGSPQRIEVVADNTLERGGVVLETERGGLDASVETQLEEIQRGFSDLLPRPKD